MHVAHVGDSRCYILRNGRLSLVTKDQSLVNQLIEAGQLRPHIGSRYPLEEAAAALQALKEGRVIGKAMVDIGT